ncbi:MAG: AMP-binding protein, partial [Magnetospirillum sp. WYHS-4]
MIRPHLAFDPGYPLPPGIALVVETSGSTGTPKGVMLSGGNLAAAVAASRRRLGLEADDAWLCCLPLTHIGGLSILHRCAEAGAAVLLHEGFDAIAVWRDLAAGRATHVSLVPAMLARLLDLADRPPPSLAVLLLIAAQRLAELALLPEDEPTPLAIIEALWAETGGLDEFEADDLYQGFAAASLTQPLDLGARTLLLHDNMLWYLRERLNPDGLRTAHRAMVAALDRLCGGDWTRLPNAYAWRHAIRHLRGAEDARAETLLTDYAWLKSKLAATSAQDLYESFIPEPTTEPPRLIGRALAMGVPALTRYPDQLPLQITGRLKRIDAPTLAPLLTAAKGDIPGLS